MFILVLESNLGFLACAASILLTEHLTPFLFFLYAEAVPELSL